jgi:hypothetical protein
MDVQGGRRPSKEASMIDRNRRGFSSAGNRARVAIAAAVLVGGSAVGVVAVSASHSGATTAQSAGFATSNRHTIGEASALTTAFSQWSKSPAKSLTTLSKMTPMRSFTQVRVHGTTFAAQRGIVVLATKKFLVVKSAHGGGLHLWFVGKGTAFKNVGATASGMAAMTGSATATTAAMTTGNMMPAATVMAGSTSAVTQMATTPAKPATITIATGTEVITITIASSMATVTQPVTTTATRMTKSTQPAFRATMGVHRGDLIFLAGTRVHGMLTAKIVLFAAPGKATPRPTASATPSMTASATPSVTPSATVSPTTSVSAAPTTGGTHY